jgi:hypothetical protein
MPIIYVEGIKTSLLTLIGCILGFMGGKVDTVLNNTRFMTSPSEFTNFQIQFPLISIFTFVRSRPDSKEKNSRDRSQQELNTVYVYRCMTASAYKYMLGVSTVCVYVSA